MKIKRTKNSSDKTYRIGTILDVDANGGVEAISKILGFKPSTKNSDLGDYSWSFTVESDAGAGVIETIQCSVWSYKGSMEYDGSLSAYMPPWVGRRLFPWGYRAEMQHTSVFRDGEWQRVSTDGYRG